MRQVHFVLGCLALAAQAGYAAPIRQGTPIINRPIEESDFANTDPCSDANILPPKDPEVGRVNGQLSVTVRVFFKNVQLQDAGNGTTSLNCSLFSRLPAAFAEKGLTARIATGKVTLRSRLADPKLTATADVSMGAVEANFQTNNLNYHLSHGLSLSEDTSMARHPGEASFIARPKPENDGGDDAIANKVMSWDGAANSNSYYAIEVPFSASASTQGNSIASWQNLANDFSVTLINAGSNRGMGIVILESVEFTLVPAN